MALITCTDCGREISERAAACVGCGAPIAKGSGALQSKLSSNGDGTFSGTKSQLVKITAKAVLQIGWKLDNADEVSGLVAFTTGMTFGSFSGVSGTIYIEEVDRDVFNLVGSAKQNSLPTQITLNLFNEAGKKVEKVINTVRQLINDA